MHDDIERGALAFAGSEDWQAEMQIRIYRSVQRGRDAVERFWTHIAGAA